MSDDLVKRLEKWRHIDNAASNIIREAAATIRTLQEQLKTAREALARIEEAGLGGFLTPELVAKIVTTAIQNLGEPK